MSNSNNSIFCLSIFSSILDNSVLTGFICLPNLVSHNQNGIVVFCKQYITLGLLLKINSILRRQGYQYDRDRGEHYYFILPVYELPILIKLRTVSLNCLFSSLPTFSLPSSLPHSLATLWFSLKSFYLSDNLEDKTHH